MSGVDVFEADCPADVVDRLLWRNAQRILNRHAVKLDGSCHWCGRPAPCDARELARRAAEVARMPWHEAWRLRNEITGMLPVITAELRARRPPRPPTLTSDPSDLERSRPVARSRTRTWIRVEVRGSPH